MTLRSFFAITNIRVQIVSLSPVLLGTLMALVKGAPLGGLELTLMVLSAFAIGLGTTAWNTGIDYLKGVDTHESNRDHSRALVMGTASAGEALATALVLFTIGSGLGLWLSLLTSLKLILVGIFCLAVALFYSAGPLPFSRTPLGEIIVGLTQGSILFCLSYYVEARSLSPDVLWLSGPSGLFVALVLAVNNNCDREGDQAAGRRTLSILLGRFCRWLVPGLGVAGLLVFAAACSSPVFKPWTPWVVVLCLGVAAPLLWRIDRRGYSHATKGPNMGDALGFFTLFTVVEAATLTAQIL